MGGAISGDDRLIGGRRNGVDHFYRHIWRRELSLLESSIGIKSEDLEMG